MNEWVGGQRRREMEGKPKQREVDAGGGRWQQREGWAGQLAGGKHVVPLVFTLPATPPHPLC